MSLMVQWLRLHTLSAGSTGLIRVCVCVCDYFKIFSFKVYQHKNKHKDPK